MRPLRLLCAALLLLGAASCGSSDASPSEAIDDGYTALSAGSPGDALASFESALAALTEADPSFLEAKIGEIRARCYSDAVQAKTDLLGLSKAAGVEAKHYNQVVTDFVAAATKQASADKDAATATINQAVELLTQGKENFPEYTKWDGLIKKVGDKATALGSADALATLKGLGYVGGD